MVKNSTICYFFTQHTVLQCHEIQTGFGLRACFSCFLAFISCFPVFVSVILQKSCFYVIFVGKNESLDILSIFWPFLIRIFYTLQGFWQLRPLIFKNFLVDPNYIGVSYLFNTTEDHIIFSQLNLEAKTT